MRLGEIQTGSTGEFGSGALSPAMNLRSRFPSDAFPPPSVAGSGFDVAGMAISEEGALSGALNRMSSIATAGSRRLSGADSLSFARLLQVSILAYGSRFALFAAAVQVESVSTLIALVKHGPQAMSAAVSRRSTRRLPASSLSDKPAIPQPAPTGPLVPNKDAEKPAAPAPVPPAASSTTSSATAKASGPSALPDKIAVQVTKWLKCRDPVFHTDYVSECRLDLMLPQPWAISLWTLQPMAKFWPVADCQLYLCL
jgi:hypothetical protein